MLSYIILATFIISLISFVGVFTLALNKKLLNSIVFYLVALAAGALLGGAFFHLIPEAFAEFPEAPIFVYVLTGFILFFMIEKVLHWRHCHKEHCEIHTFAYTSLIGDSVHNFIDGLVIAAGFMVNPALGITTTVAIALHEIPQEIGDFGVLVHGGFKKTKALFYNFLTAVTAVIGGIVGYFVSNPTFLSFLLPFTAGGFIYISASDLIPEIRKEISINKSIFIFAMFLIGIGIMYFSA